MTGFIESPLYAVEIAAGALAAGGTYTVSFDETSEWQKYLPFNNLVITNTSQQKLRVEYMPDRLKLIPAGSIIPIEKRGIRGCKLTNLESAVNSDIIEIAMYRAPSVEDIAIARALKIDLTTYLDGGGL